MVDLCRPSTFLTRRKMMTSFFYLITTGAFLYFLMQTTVHRTEVVTKTGLKHQQQQTSNQTKTVINAPNAVSNKANLTVKSTAATNKSSSANTTPTQKKVKNATQALAPTKATVTEEPEVPGSCPKTPPGLEGKWVPRMEILDWKTQEAKHPELSIGGRWRPKDCHARHRLAILLPYRNRDEHLHIFINNMHDFLQRQQLDYGIYVIEQAGKSTFNRATLFNVGFKEAMKDHSWHCIALHDVDHIPLNDQNLYSCPPLPRHLSVAVEKFRFRMPYSNYFGGVSLMKSDQYTKINGMSNQYWGWGGEDDDFYQRCAGKGLLPILRYPAKIGAYTTIQKYHQRAPANPKRMGLLGGARRRQDKDGLSDLKYTVLKKEYKRLYTYILTDVGRMARR